MAINITFFLPNLSSGGAETVTLRFLEGLSANKFRVTLVVVQRQGELLLSVPKHVQVVFLDINRVSRSMPGLIAYLRNASPDIIFSTTHRMNLMVAIAKLFSFSSSFMMLRLPNSPQLEKTQRAYGWIVRLLFTCAYKAADIVIAQTPDMRLEAATIFGVDLNRIKVFSNPIDHTKIRKMADGLQTPFKHDRLNIVAIGRLAFEKGFDLLIEAFGEVAKARVDGHLHIVGTDRGHKEDLLCQVAQLGLVDRVTFWGYQANPYLFQKYADVFVLPSRREGLPNVVLEAMAFRKPIVATRCCSFVEDLIQVGQRGVLVPVGDPARLAEGILRALEMKDITASPYQGDSVEELFLMYTDQNIAV